MNSIKYVFLFYLIAGPIQATNNQKLFYFIPPLTSTSMPLSLQTPASTAPQIDVFSIDFLLGPQDPLFPGQPFAVSSTIHLPTATPQSIAQGMKLIKFIELEKLPADHGLSKEELTTVLMFKAQQSIKELKEKIETKKTSSLSTHEKNTDLDDVD